MGIGMTICTFFGDSDAPETIRKALRKAIEELITSYGVESFQVGNEGRFSEMVKEELALMSEKYPHIGYTVLVCGVRYDEIPYETVKKEHLLLISELSGLGDKADFEGCNKLMFNVSDYIVTYVRDGKGYAAEYKAKAEKLGVTAINL